MRLRLRLATVGLLALVLATGFTFPLTPRSPAGQEATWLMLAVNDFRLYSRGLQVLWDVPEERWDATGKALTERDRAFWNATVVPSLGAWHQLYWRCPVPAWSRAILAQG